MMKKGLYVTATPIGNLGDISERAKEALKAAEYIACEDTRVTRKLFSLLGIGQDKTFIAYEDHSEEERAQKIIDLINREETAVVLVSDAGSPLISDPGYKLVRKCREQKVPVYVLPGCCAVISALQLSGLPTNRFMFAGFIPNREKARADLFAELAGVNTTLVFYETAPRLTKTLAAAVEFFRGRELAVAREMTKMFEECVNGGAEELIAHFTQNPPKGEIVLMVAPALKAAGREPQTVHCDNSAGVMLHPDWPEGLARERCMARPGIILYGYDPSDEVRFGQFRPVMTLKTVVSMVKEMQPGQSASYGRRFTADKPTLVATLCTGYADGYPRQLSCGKGIVEIHGKACPVLGRVCMDQMMVDVTGIPDIHEGDEAILWGGSVSDTAETIARKTDTISYEVLCGVSRRVPRVYLEHGKIVDVEDWILEA